jgi:hypothetical protein
MIEGEKMRKPKILFLPIEGGAPVWYIERDLVTKEILPALLDKVITNQSLPGREVFQQNILEALSEFG